MDEILEKIKEGVFKAKDEAEKITKVAVQKTSSAVGQAKLGFAINEIEGKIKDIYVELGKILYNEHKDGSEFESDINEKCVQIDDLYGEIMVLNEKVAEIKNTVICSNCGEHNVMDNVFCGNCGNKMKDEE